MLAEFNESLGPSQLFVKPGYSLNQNFLWRNKFPQQEPIRTCIYVYVATSCSTVYYYSSVVHGRQCVMYSIQVFNAHVRR